MAEDDELEAARRRGCLLEGLSEGLCEAVIWNVDQRGRLLACRPVGWSGSRSCQCHFFGKGPGCSAGPASAL